MFPDGIRLKNIDEGSSRFCTSSVFLCQQRASSGVIPGATLTPFGEAAHTIASSIPITLEPWN